jgi:hypothetical protein
VFIGFILGLLVQKMRETQKRAMLNHKRLNELFHI